MHASCVLNATSCDDRSLGSEYVVEVWARCVAKWWQIRVFIFPNLFPQVLQQDCSDYRNFGSKHPQWDPSPRKTSKTIGKVHYCMNGDRIQGQTQGSRQVHHTCPSKYILSRKCDLARRALSTIIAFFCRFSRFLSKRISRGRICVRRIISEWYRT